MLYKLSLSEIFNEAKFIKCLSIFLFLIVATLGLCGVPAFSGCCAWSNNFALECRGSVGAAGGLHCPAACEILVPDQRLNPSPLH